MIYVIKNRTRREASPVFVLGSGSETVRFVHDVLQRCMMPGCGLIRRTFRGTPDPDKR